MMNTLFAERKNRILSFMRDQAKSLNSMKLTSLDVPSEDREFSTLLDNMIEDGLIIKTRKKDLLFLSAWACHRQVPR